MTAPDKFSAFDDDDLERSADLLGKCGLRYKIFGYELFHFFPAWFSETAYSVAGDRAGEGKGWLVKLETVDKNKRFCSQGKLLDE